MGMLDDHARLSNDTSAEHDAIVKALHALEAALASPARGREARWLRRVKADLQPLIEAVIEHCRAAEAPRGLVRELEAAIGRPHELRVVSEDHSRIAAEARDLLSSLSALPDAGEVRTRAARLSADLRAHLAHEADLIYEAFMRDIGVGD